MKTTLILALSLSFSSVAWSQITEFEIPFGNRLPVRNIDGTITVGTDSTSSTPVLVGKEFYGADTHGFSRLPRTSLVAPLKLSRIRLGGNLYDAYNWELNSFFDLYTDRIAYVYSPLERRLRYIKSNYQINPLVQVNMLGWQPDRQVGTDELSYQETASETHAARLLTHLNGEMGLNVRDFALGNEPFLWKYTHGKPLPSADEYIEKFVRYAVALRDAQAALGKDPNAIKIHGPSIATGWIGFQTAHPDDCITDWELPETVSCSYGDGQFTEFVPYFVHRLAELENDPVANPQGYKLLDVLTFNYYPLFRTDFTDTESIITKNNGEQNVTGMLEATNVWDNPSYINRHDNASPRGIVPNILEKFKRWSQINKSGLSFGVTEFGIDSLENIGYHPIVRPLYLADFVPRLARSGATLFIHSFLQSGAGPNAWALINQGKESPLYYIYSLYTNHFTGEVVPTQETYADNVNSYAVRQGANTQVFVVNKDARPHNASLRTSAEGRELAEVNLPAWSLTVFTIPEGENGTIRVRQYGAREMGISLEQ